MCINFTLLLYPFWSFWLDFIYNLTLLILFCMLNMTIRKLWQNFLFFGWTVPLMQSSLVVSHLVIAMHNQSIIIVILTAMMTCLNVLFASLQSAWDFPILSQRSPNPRSHIHDFLWFVGNPENTQVFVYDNVLWIKRTLMQGMACSFC